jgi:hypothetical protein
MDKQDVTIGGPGTPVSLNKVVLQLEMRKINLLVDGTGMGILKDAPNTVYITPEECQTQAKHYVDNIFNGRNIPAYLYRYMSYMFIDNAPEYKTDADLVEAFNSGKLSEEHEDYKHILNLIRWSNVNKEASQVIGMIQLIAGSLRIAAKNKAGIRLYLEHPEASLHPKRQSRAMSMILKLDEEYGYKDPNETKTDE